MNLLRLTMAMLALLGVMLLGSQGPALAKPLAAANGALALAACHEGQGSAPQLTASLDGSVAHKTVQAASPTKAPISMGLMICCTLPLSTSPKMDLAEPRLRGVKVTYQTQVPLWTGLALAPPIAPPNPLKI